MKKMIFLLVLMLGFAASAQVEDGAYYNEETGQLTIVLFGQSKIADLNDIKESGQSLLITKHYVYLLNSEGAPVDYAKLGPADNSTSTLPLTGNLEVDIKNLSPSNEIDLGLENFDFHNYSREKILDIKGLPPVYMSGLELNN
jgi:hypothetical protein